MELKGKVALITGGGTGLGREIALQLAQEGMAIAVNYSRSQQEAEETMAELQKFGVTAQTVQADVSKRDQVREMIATVDRQFGRLDLLINNAGTTRFIPMNDLDAVTEDDWDDLMAVNVKGAFMAAQAVAPIMRRNGGGQIINTSSIAGLRPSGSSLPYCVSKAALIHLTHCLATALAPDIMVNSVAPGLLVTRWGEKFGQAVIDQMAEAALLKKVTDLGDTAAAYVMLAKNGSITGQIITVDAGLTR